MQATDSTPSSALDPTSERLTNSPIKVLLVASGGGHWVQLMRISPAFSEHVRVYVTTIEGYAPEVGGRRLYVIGDANLRHKLGLLCMACRILLILLRERPDLV